jgi:tetratricopeptide (TPR) repeat protein
MTIDMNATMHVMPPGADFTLHQANELTGKGRFQQAVEYYDQLIGAVPDFACFWNSKGVALEGLNRVTEALACYEKAIQIDPFHAEAWYNRGIALRQAGRGKEGEKCQKIASCLEQGREVGSYASTQPSVAISG